MAGISKLHLWIVLTGVCVCVCVWVRTGVPVCMRVNVMCSHSTCRREARVCVCVFVWCVPDVPYPGQLILLLPTKGLTEHIILEADSPSDLNVDHITTIRSNIKKYDRPTSSSEGVRLSAWYVAVWKVLTNWMWLVIGGRQVPYKLSETAD